MRFLPILIFLSPLSLAAHLRLQIPATSSLPNPSTLPPTTTAVLTTLSSVHKAPLRNDNTFDFRNVSTGSYLLDVHSATHAFTPLRVDVHESSDGATVEVWGTFRGNEWGNKGEAVPVTFGEGFWVFEVKSVAVKDYLMQRSGFSPLSLLKNPMILIAGASMLLVFGMPYLMDNMDPELKAEFEKSQKAKAASGTQPANALQNFDAAAWLSGAGTKKESTSSSSVVEERGVTR